MWAQAGFTPDDFWHQTPLHFQLVMRGVRKRLEIEANGRTALAYETGAFSGLASNGKLKAFKHYQRDAGPQTPEQMLEMLKAMGGKSNMTVKRVQRAND